MTQRDRAMTKPTPTMTERLRQMFIEHGLSIYMDDRPENAYPFDPFAWLASEAEAGAEPGIDVERLAEAFYNVSQFRMAFLPNWRDTSIETGIWDKAVADAVEVATEYARLTEAAEAMQRALGS